MLGRHVQVDRICSRLKHICGAEGITVNRQVILKYGLAPPRIQLQAPERLSIASYMQ